MEYWCARVMSTFFFLSILSLCTNFRRILDTTFYSFTSCSLFDRQSGIIVFRLFDSRRWGRRGCLGSVKGDSSGLE